VTIGWPLSDRPRGVPTNRKAGASVTRNRPTPTCFAAVPLGPGAAEGGRAGAAGHPGGGRDGPNVDEYEGADCLQRRSPDETTRPSTRLTARNDRKDCLTAAAPQGTKLPK